MYSSIATVVHKGALQNLMSAKNSHFEIFFALYEIPHDSMCAEPVFDMF